MFYELLKRTHLFCNLTKNELDDALLYLSAKRLSYKKGETLIKLGSRITVFGIVLKGFVSVCSDDLNGNQMIMATVLKGEMFSESLAITNNSYSPVYAVAGEDTDILWLSAAPIRENRPK